MGQYAWLAGDASDEQGHSLGPQDIDAIFSAFEELYLASLEVLESLFVTEDEVSRRGEISRAPRPGGGGTGAPLRGRCGPRKSPRRPPGPPQDGSGRPARPNAMLQHRFRTWVCSALLTGPVPIPQLLRGLFKRTLSLFSSHALSEVAGDRGGDADDEGDPPILAFGEPTDVMMDVSVSSVPALGPAGAGNLGHVGGMLSELGLGGEVDWALSSAVVGHVQECLSALESPLDRPCLTALQQYSRTVLLGFLAQVLPAPRGRGGGAGAGPGDSPRGSSGDRARDRARREAVEAALDGWTQRLDLVIYDGLLVKRMGQMFDIIRDLPETEPAIQDVRVCLTYTLRQRELAETLREQLRQRLLVPGADTPTILEQYVAVIQALRALDPGGSLVEAAGAPVRAYLRESRTDAIRCLVSMLTGDAEAGDGLDSLQQELTRVPEEGSDGEDADHDSQVWRAATEWTVPRTDESRNTRDLVAFLVGIYGNREQFLNEYRSLLASRVLSNPGFDVERDIRTLELLKMRFEGERAMEHCEVMLKDVSDSRRLASTVRTAPAPAGAGGAERPPEWFSALVVSHLYWPLGPREDVALPGPVRDAMERFAATYARLKKPRQIAWMPHLGSVTLEVSVDGAAKEFDVSPAHAAVVSQFQDRATWEAAELGAACGMGEATLARVARFWVAQGILREAPGGAGGGTYSRVDSLDAEEGRWGGQEDDDAGAGVGGAGDAEAEKVAVHEQYILGMLANFEDELPVSRIHNMLKMFVIDGSYDATEEQLARFVHKLAAEEKLVLQGGMVSRHKG